MIQRSYVTRRALAAVAQTLSRFTLMATVIALAVVTISMEMESIQNLQLNPSTTTESLQG